MEKLKGLWVGDAVAATGFARVNHSILDNLPTEDYDIHFLGINYFGDPHEYPYKIYPAKQNQGDLYGFERFPMLVQALKPDFIFMLNDPWIISQYLASIESMDKRPPIIVYFPVDAKEHSKSFYDKFWMVNNVCVYTNFAKDVIKQTGAKFINIDKVNVIPHGIDKNKFFPIDKESARKQLYPNDRADEFMNSFIVLNGNRNQPRKRMDITMWAFREFQKNKPDVKLYLHMGVTDMGFNIAELAERYGFADKTILTSATNRVPSVPVTYLNLIYNATDIGLNTAVGEGWGLVNWEHAATGKPQLLPNNSVLPEIWGDGALFYDAKTPHMIERINTLGYAGDYRDIAAKLEWAYDDWKHGGEQLAKIAQIGFDKTQEEKYDWSEIGKQFDKVIKSSI